MCFESKNSVSIINGSAYIIKTIPNVATDKTTSGRKVANKIKYNDPSKYPKLFAIIKQRETGKPSRLTEM